MLSIVGDLSGETLPARQGSEGRSLEDNNDLVRIAKALLQSNAVPMSHNTAFTGKPETRIHANDAWVLKVNAAGHGFGDAQVATKWCALQIEKERSYGIYHPQRTWLLFAESGRYLVANLSPRLVPLHQVDFSVMHVNERSQVLLQLLEMYLGFTARFDLRLDEGLSNFACCDGRVIYLDDDIYRWDSFTSLSAMLANWLRKAPVLCLNHDAIWQTLGERMRPLLHACSSDAEDMVFEAMIDQGVGEQEAFKQTFLHALHPRHGSGGLAQPDVMAGDLAPIGLISDVHANLPALKAILACLDQRGIERIIMLGDVVGYGPNPADCIAVLRQREVFCIRGNHDHYVAHRGDVRVAMGIMAKKIADWTIPQLDDAERAWLGALPVRYSAETWMAVHGAPADKSFFNAYIYDSTFERNLKHLHGLNMPICLHGHSHIQGIYVMRSGHCMLAEAAMRYDLSGLDAALVCPGSVGQPRSADDRAQAAIFYPATRSVEMLSVDYDMDAVIADMESNDFPVELINRLRS